MLEELRVPESALESETMIINLRLHLDRFWFRGNGSGDPASSCIFSNST